MQKQSLHPKDKAKFRAIGRRKVTDLNLDGRAALRKKGSSVFLFKTSKIWNLRMNYAVTKAFVPTHGVIPVPKPVNMNAVSLDLYPRQYRCKVVYSICVPDEPDGKYGPDGKIRMKSKYAEFIDIYA